MKHLSTALFGLALCFLLSTLGAAQTANFLAVAKIACTPEKITRCTSDDKCESRDASAKDKSEVLVIDFAGKKASVRSGGKQEPFGDIDGDEVTGEERRFSVREPGAADDSKAVKMTLSRSGKLTILIDGNRHRAEATCTPES